MNDTICAISTSVGVSAINIIRISGESAIKIVNSLATIDLNKYNSNTINYAFIKENEEIIDEVLISIFKNPKSFTGEDLIEINCHGGIAVTNKILELLIINGARLADKGEFTKRAFLNGKLDLIQAESIMDLIAAKTQKSRIQSINAVTKKVSNMINALREDILKIISNIEVNIDYPEYEDITVMDNNLVNQKLESILVNMNEILETSNNSKIISNGLKLGIIGKPNVGKSSILNLLLEEEKAIVTPIAGTTRDIVEGTIIIDGIEINLIDTAGIRTTTNQVEQIGINKSKQIITTSDLIILVLNNNEQLDEEDIRILKETKDLNRIILINKSDLKNNLDVSIIEDEFTNISVINEDSINLIKKLISNKLKINNIADNDYTYLTSARAIALYKKALDEIIQAYNTSTTLLPTDIVLIYLKQAWDYLGEITGVSYDEELLDNLFENYCLGK